MLQNHPSLVAPTSSDTGFYPYTVDNSCRFDDNDSAQLGRTPSSAGNRKTWTYSVWIKRSTLATRQILFGSCPSTASNNNTWLTCEIDETTNVVRIAGWNTTWKRTNAVFRDTSAWYHLVFVFDTTQGTGSDRSAIYINGVEATYQDNNSPSSNTNYAVNDTKYHTIGSRQTWNGDSYFDGYMAQACFIDGQALTPSSFGEDKNGIWVPKDVSDLTFGTNGFYLDFADSSALGNDVSGNNNDFTSSGLTASDQMTDTPTNNFATYNPLSNYPTAGGATGVLGNGSLQLQGAADNSYTGGVSTLGIAPDTGIYYAEYLMTIDNRNSFGITSWNSSHANGSGNNQATYGYYLFAASSTGTSTIYELAVSSQTGLTDITAGDIVGIVYDSDNLTLDFYINNAQVGTTVSVTSQTYQFFGDGYGVSPRVLNKANFGQDSSFGGSKTAQNNPDTKSIGDFYYTRASVEGAKALCTANLPEPTIGPNIDSANTAALPEDQFSILLYEGNSTNNRDITGVGFDPDLGIFKNRDEGYGWIIVDRNRGDGWSFGFDTGTEESGTSKFDSFITDGYRIDSHPGLNRSSIVNYSWKANGSGVSNTDGSITSTVSANTDAGISIATYTGTGSAATVGHGLGVAPKAIIIKNRDTSTNWTVGHTSIGWTDFLNLNSTSGKIAASSVWNNTAPTSTVFTVNTSGIVNTNTDRYAAYLFAEVEGFSSFGSYAGNGNTSGDGPFIYTGFRPAFIMTKRTDTSGYHWVLMDDARDTYNPADEWLYVSSSSAGVSNSSTRVDFLSNGFKCIGESSTQNASGATYIYMAFAENPFKYSNAR